MPPRLNSRYEFSIGKEDENGTMFLAEREPFRFDPKLKGTKRYTFKKGDSLYTIAYRSFQPIPNAEHLWWIICEFQPDPILDPTLAIDIGRVLFIPSVKVVQEKVFGF